MARLDAGQNKAYVPPAKPKKIVRRVAPSPPPVTDVQSSGGNYGTKKAAAFKKTAVYKRSVGAAKPVRQTDATSSARTPGGNYGLPLGQAYHTLAAKNAKLAWAGKPFDPTFVAHAINLGLPEAKGLRVDHKSGRIYAYDMVTNEGHTVGGKSFLDPKTGKRAGRILTPTAAAISTGVTDVLNQTARPFHAVAGLIQHGTHGFTEGLLHNKPYSFGKALSSAGLPKGVAGPLGFAADVAADPTTYLTFGAGSIGRHAAEEAATKALSRAAKAGMSEAGSETVARAAAKRALANAPEGSGVTVKFAGRSVPGVTKATGAAGRVVKRAVAKAPEPVRSVAVGAKKVASDVRPQLTPHGATQAEHQAVRAAGRQARSVARMGVGEAERRAQAARALIPKDQYEHVIAAVESNKIGTLPAELRAPARDIRDALRHAKRVRRQAGIGEGDITKVARTEAPAEAQAAMVRATTDRKAAESELRRLEGDPATPHVQVDAARSSVANARRLEQVARQRVKFVAGHEGAVRSYFPHMLAPEGKAATEAPAIARKGVRKVKLQTSKQRSDLRPISAQNPERVAAGETPFSTNLPAVLADYHAGTAAAVAAKDLAANLVKAGRRFKEGMQFDPANDRVFHYHNGDLTPLAEHGKPKIPASEKPRAGQYVVLNRQTVEREFANIAPQADRSAFGAVFDRGTAGFKRIATATPGFHMRNLVGDTQMAYLAQPGHKLPGNIASGFRAVKRLSAVEHAQTKTLARVSASAKTLKVAGKPVNIDSFLADAQRNGVIRSGYIGRELREQGKGIGGKERAGGRLTRAGHRINRWMQNREDLLRLATYKHGLDKGMSAQQAAELSLGVHIDYGDLTKFERTVARRAMPFYTFSARALPIHVKALVKTPGKFANIEKAREEIANSTGVDLQQAQGDLKTFQARQAPIILQLGGKKYVLSDSLPLILLNEVPTKASLGAYVNELSQWVASLANPILKDPIELYANRSFFFRSDIQNPNYPLVAAPSWVSVIYKNDPGLAKKLGIVPDYVDKRSGRKTWGWNGKSDYIFKSVPGLINYAQQLSTQAANRRGQGTGQKLLSVLSGVRVEPLDPAGAAMEILFQKHDQISQQANSYGRRAKTPENLRALAKLRAEQHSIEQQIYKLSVKQGDKVPVFSNSVPSQRPPSSGGLGGGLGGGGLGGGLGGGGLSG